MGKHTPGPWRQGAEFREGRLMEIWTESGLGLVAKTDNEADARLIAAAPELLDACRLALAYMQERGAHDTAERAAPLRAAIEKATGEAP